MSAEKVAYIREQNNNTAVDRLFLDEPLSEIPIPNPVETFDQCFSDYPDLMRKFIHIFISYLTLFKCIFFLLLLFR